MIRYAAVILVSLTGCATHEPQHAHKAYVDPLPLPPPAMPHVERVVIYVRAPNHPRACPPNPRLPLHETTRSLGEYIGHLIIVSDACRAAAEHPLP